MLIEVIPIFQNLVSILASAASIGKDLQSTRSSSTVNHTPSADLEKEIDDYISSARNTLAEVNMLLATNVSVLTSAEFHLHANRSDILGEELKRLRSRRQTLKGIDSDSLSSTAGALHDDAQASKAESEELRVTVSLVSAIAQRRAQALRTLKELTLVCDEDPTFQRRLDFLSLSREIISINKTLDTICKTSEELVSPTLSNDHEKFLPSQESDRLKALTRVVTNKGYQ